MYDKGIRFLNRHVQQRFSGCFENEFPKTSSQPARVVARRNAGCSAFPLATPSSPLLVEVMALGAPAVGVRSSQGRSTHRRGILTPRAVCLQATHSPARR